MTVSGRGRQPNAVSPTSAAEQLNLDRRTVLAVGLRAGAATALAGGLPGLLAACGKTTPPPPKDRYFYVGYAPGTVGPGSPPLGDLIRLVAARARQRDVSPLLPLIQAEADPLASLRRHIGYTAARDPSTGEHPLAFKVVVAAMPDLTAIDEIAAGAVKIGVKVVSYLLDVQPRTAAIIVDAAQMGTLLATHAATWAEEHLHGRGQVLILRPGRADLTTTSTPLFAATAKQTTDAMRDTLARRAPGLKITTPTPADTTTALRSHPDARIVLCWSDEQAVGVAGILRERDPRGRDTLYVGGVGQPATSRSAIAELRRAGVLRALVVARPRDLANALVDLPSDLLAGKPARDIRVPVVTLTPGSAALAAHASDYGKDPDALVARLQALAAVPHINPRGPEITINPPS